MSLHNTFTRNIYWPLAQKIKGERAAEILRILAASQWKSRDELLDMQWQLVRNTVNNAIQDVPYYQETFSNVGWDFCNKEFSYEDFLKIPLLEKQTVRDRTSELLKSNFRGRVTKGLTSGSTGESLSLFYCGEHESYSEAARWRAKDWWGVKPGYPQVSIWGRPYTGYLDRLNQSIKSYFMNTLMFSAFDLNEDRVACLWEKISRFKPSIIYGYPSAISTIAGYAKENGIIGNNLGIKVVIITAEASNSLQRELIEDVFGCKTANEYGCSETGGFVYECPHGCWHISSELTFIEFLGKEGVPVQFGEPGEIVVTHLRNGYMPLIRYRVGDIGSPVPDKCNCGRGLPLMQVSVAKERDFVQLPNGERHTSEIFVYITKAVLKQFPCSILHFKVIQKAFDLLEIQIVPGANELDKALDLFRQMLRKQLGQKIQIKFKKLSGIEREPSGKLRYFISEVHAPSIEPLPVKHLPLPADPTSI
jgi:phenylacetate-CoA ligase